MKLLIILISLSFKLVYLFNPGIIAKFPKESLYEVTKRSLSVLNPEINHLQIDKRFETDLITFKGIELRLENIKIDQIKFNFTADPKFIRTSISNVKFVVKSPVDVHAWVFQTCGWFTVNGTIDTIDFEFQGRQFDNDFSKKPYVHSVYKSININSEKISVLPDIDYIPDFIMSMIVRLIKDTMIKSVCSTLLEFMNRELSTNINSEIKKGYPESLPIDNTDMSLQTELTDPLYFDENNIFFPIEGTIFITKKGFQRDVDSSIMEFGQADSHLFDFYLSDYTMRTFMASIANDKKQFTIPDFSASILSYDQLVDFSFHKNGLHVKKFKSDNEVHSFSKDLSIKSDISLVVRPWITKQENFVLNMYFESFEINEIEVKSTYSIDDFLVDAFKTYLPVYLSKNPECSARIPELSLLGFKWVNWSLDICENHARIGVSI